MLVAAQKGGKGLPQMGEEIFCKLGKLESIFTTRRCGCVFLLACVASRSKSSPATLTAGTHTCCAGLLRRIAAPDCCARWIAPPNCSAGLLRRIAAPDCCAGLLRRMDCSAGLLRRIAAQDCCAGLLRRIAAPDCCAGLLRRIAAPDARTGAEFHPEEKKGELLPNQDV